MAASPSIRRIVGHRGRSSGECRLALEDSGIRVVQTPYQAERLVRSIRAECLSRVMPFDERHLRRTLAEFLEHYHRERNHQDLGNALIDRAPPPRRTVGFRRRQRLGATRSVTICPSPRAQLMPPWCAFPLNLLTRSGPRASSQLMVDKITTVSTARLQTRVGRLSDEEMIRLNRAVIVFLGLAGPAAHAK